MDKSHENPYQCTPNSLQYYTDDVTTLPTQAIWRFSRQRGVIFCAIVFPMLLLRRLLGWRLKAFHATCRLNELPPIVDAEVLARVRDEFAPYETVCRKYAMEHVRTFQPPWIGGKSGALAVWLHPDGEFHCTITCIDIRLGNQHRRQIVFSCHTSLESGLVLHTSPLSPEEWIPELVPPNDEMLGLRPDASPDEVIEAHLQRISRQIGIIRKTAESLMPSIVQESQDHFDFLVAKGIYVPLSSQEAQRLLSNVAM